MPVARHFFDEVSFNFRVCEHNVDERVQFFRFCIVGGAVFIADLLVFAMLVTWLQTPFIARILSFWVAITLSWCGNANFAFKNARKTQATTADFVHYFFACHGAGLINLLVYGSCVLLGWPLSVGFVLGVVAGLSVNYWFARYLFKRQIAGV